jgi:hypothetical protein
MELIWRRIGEGVVLNDNIFLKVVAAGLEIGLKLEGPPGTKVRCRGEHFSLGEKQVPVTIGGEKADR